MCLGSVPPPAVFNLPVQQWTSPLDFRASAFPKIVMTRAPGRTKEVLLLKQKMLSSEQAVSSVSFTALPVLSNILLLLLQLGRRFSPREKNNELLTRTSELAMLLGTDHPIKQEAKWEELLIGNRCPIDAEITAPAVLSFKHGYQYVGHLFKLKNLWNNKPKRPFIHLFKIIECLFMPDTLPSI